MSEHLKLPDDSNNNGPSPEEKAAAHSRRSFLFKLSVLLNAAVGTVLAVPIAGYLFGPAIKKSSATGSWINIGSVDDFPVGETRLVDFQSPVARLGDGETAKVACWVRRVSAQQFQVFAINCAHLGCPVRWFAQSKLFMCPCHGGAYYEDGSRASGPPERGLFEYQYQVKGNLLAIHAGDMPTLATQASCSEANKPLVHIQPAMNEATSETAETRSTQWQG
ncbi:QcrA and Rieske domain-containing protein [Acidicapsa ligni]|uniref:QcrA and Rieske domain-containing protein n=1 Tax=Acidicapsa ligni TaxID=542300 RepID=UPI0021E0513D|nr:Rieske 2Fe-2S domain-containing protein [Acidicapsa ligni]